MRRVGSLLQPGARPAALDDADRFAMLLAYLVAFAVRWDLRKAQPYIAETWHFVSARGLWDSSTNILPMPIGSAPLDLSWFFWQRPFLALPFHWAAEHSFGAYRALHIVLAATVPPLALWLLRSLGTGRAAAVAAAVVLGVHPMLVPWGVMVLPDSLVLALGLGALLAAHHGRPAATAGLLWAATWVKEVAFVLALALAVLALWRDGDGSRASLRPPRIGPFARWLLPVVPLAFLPLWVSMQVPGALFPGFRPGGDWPDILEHVFLLLWLAPPAALGIASPRLRRFTLAALAWPAFFLLYHELQGKAMEPWYYVLPGSFTLLAAAAAIDGAARAPTPVLRHAGRLAAVAVAALLWVQVSVPPDDARNTTLVTPLTHAGQWDLAQVQSFERVRDAGLARLVQLPGPDERRDWIALDVEVSFLYHPLSGQAERVHAVWAGNGALEESVLLAWQQAIEADTQVTIVAVHDGLAGNIATRAAYAECSDVDGAYVLIRAARCQGAGDDLWERHQEALAAAAAAPEGPATPF